MRINLPNQITLARLALIVVFFALLTMYQAGADANRHWLLSVCFWIFLVCALGDVLDGYLARALGQVTAFGRVLDPVVDKVMVCGAFVYFAGSGFVAPGSGTNVTGVAPWMVVVVLAREFLVSAIRALSESSGASFAATWPGKLKMFVQSATVCIVLGVLAWYEDLAFWRSVRIVAVWATVIVTAISALQYMYRARELVLSPTALGGAPQESA